MRRRAVESSAATAIGYDAQRCWLEVEYTSGGLYRYLGVPNQVYAELLAADSIGTYLNQHVKPCYRYIRLIPGRS